MVGTVVRWGLLNGRFFWKLLDANLFNGRFHLKKEKIDPFFSHPVEPALFFTVEISSKKIPKNQVIGRVSIAKIFFNLAIFLCLVL